MLINPFLAVVVLLATSHAYASSLERAFTDSALLKRDVPTIPASQCTSTPIECCANFTPADNPTIAPLLAGAGIVPKDPTLFAAIGCSPLPAGINATW